MLSFACPFWRFSGARELSHFTLVDAALVVLSLVATLWVGLYVKRYVGGIEDYLVAGRGMGLYIGTASLVSTEIGIITYAYQAQFGFLAGFSAFVVGLITIAVAFTVGQTGFVITRLREARVMTVPEYFERRYGRGVRVLAGLLMAIGGSLNLGIFPLIEARFLTILTGIDPRFVTWTMAALLLLGYHVFRMGGWFLAGWGLCAAVLVYEHSILREDDLSRLNVAFFNLNGVISIALCLFTYLDLAL